MTNQADTDQVDFFDLQDRVFALTERVLRLCGEDAYLRIPAMANVDTIDGLLDIERIASDAIRIRRNRMARNRRREGKIRQLGEYSHKQLFAKFCREYAGATRGDRAWKDFLSENEYTKCEVCGGYSRMSTAFLLWEPGGRHLHHFCGEDHLAVFAADLDTDRLIEYSRENTDDTLLHELENRKGGDVGLA